MSAFGRDKMLKEGLVKFRHPHVTLQKAITFKVRVLLVVHHNMMFGSINADLPENATDKWRQRYLVFKITQAGRLQLIVYKESPATAANEIKEISIDQFGGLENNLRLDGEKYVFAIITTSITECFSVETPQELSEWSKLLQEYLGKELLVSINVPPKQPILRVGKAILRIRNTGFTITTCENPPRCQGTWQIIHIRKYGGSEIFRFQTGSKCPTGENMYSFETKDNEGLKKLFSDLSNHKPIFADDRLGRRMTLEKTFNFKVSPHAQPESPIRTGQSRKSFQVQDRTPQTPVYENREPLQVVPEYTNVSELTVPKKDVRRLSVNDMNNSGEVSVNGIAQGVSNRKYSHDATYQNIPKPGTSESISPTKKSHTTINVPVPDGYYNFPPPSLLTKSTSKNRFPSSSPEDERVSIQEIQASLRSPTKTVVPLSSSSNQADRYSPEVAMDAVGDKAAQKSRQYSPNFDQTDGTYQNLEFMHGTNGDTSKRYAPESFAVADHMTTAANVADLSTELSQHEYTNVQLARANIQGHHSALNSRKQKLSEVVSLDLDGKPRIAPKTKTHTGLLSIQQSSSIDTLMDSQPGKMHQSEMRSSLSDHELASSSSKASSRPIDYYNFCAPNLPAHIKSRDTAMNIQNKFTLSTLLTPSSSDTPSDHDSTELLSPDGPREMEYSKIATATQSRNISRECTKQNPVITTFKNSTSGTKVRSSSCDCLVSEGNLSRANWLEQQPDPKNTLYDKLLPQATKKPQSLYDSLEPHKDSPKSRSCSPDPSNPSASVRSWSRQSGYVRQIHNYEDIESQDEAQGSRSGSHSPTRMELPSEWTLSVPAKQGESDQSKQIAEKPRRLSKQMPKSQPRKRHLPLQNFKQLSHNPDDPRLSPADDFDVSQAKTKPRPPRLSRAYSSEANSSKASTYAGIHSQLQSSAEESLHSTSYSQESTLPLDVINVSQASDENVTHKPSPLVTCQMNQSTGPPPIPSRSVVSNGKDHVTSASLHISNSTPPLPPRSQHDSSKITVPLPQAQFNFKPKPPPKPKVLMTGGVAGTDPYYTSVSFLDGTESCVPQREIPLRVPPRDIPARIPRTKVPVDSELGAYVSVDFELTKGLQRTSEQVASDHRAFFEGRDHHH